MLIDIQATTQRNARLRALQSYCRPLKWREIMTERPPAELPFHDLFRAIFPSPGWAPRRVGDEVLEASLERLVEMSIGTELELVLPIVATSEEEAYAALHYEIDPEPSLLQLEHEIDESQIVEEHVLVERRRGPREPLIDWGQVSPAQLFREIASGSYLEALVARPRAFWRRATDWVIAQLLAPSVNPTGLL